MRTTAMMLVVGVLLAGGSAFGAALDRATLENVIAAPHSDQRSDPALDLFTDARVYEVTVRSYDGGGPPTEITTRAEEKRVDGRYIVTSAPHGNTGDEFHMVVHFDEQDGVYRKYVLLPGGTLTTYIGLRVGNTRSVCWTNTPLSGQPTTISIVTIETFTDSMTSWVEVISNGGEVLQQTEAHAIVVEAD